ncbi:signal transduction protein [Calothrix sp. NIES-4071]|nr:signal transduction protein [Calothrix sp. NIES-4071]BAZ62740.1 signal transduction protein [Calothrix sp. NIES-4105]
MTTAPNESTNYLSETDNTELDKLVTTLELSDGATIIFAIAPDSSPQHPVVEQFKILLSDSDENFQIQNFFYSDNSLYNFLYSLNHQANRKLIMAFGIDQLPLPRLVREMKQLNLGRESIFNRDIVIIFWLNKCGFLQEFSNRAPDFWDWRHKVVTFETRPILNPLLYSYLERLIAENSYLKISGVMQVQRQVDIFLDQIYVSLQAVRRQEVVEIEREHKSNYTQRLTIGSSSPHDLDEPSYYDEPVVLESSFSTSTKIITQKVDLSEAVRQNQYNVILGAPGAGKTTLLRYLALHYAVAKRDSQEIVTDGEQELGKTLLPVFFRIADYAERLDKQPNLTLLDYLRQYHTETEVIARILETMQQGQCLMLLDGLDEVFDQQSRRQIVECINQFTDEFAGNKFVITSRIAGYRDVQLSSRFAEFTIEDMDSEEVEKFLHRWCRAVEKAQQPEATEEQWQTAGDNQTREILEAIQDNEGVKRLTANPLLLTILALIHRNGARLPNRRVELYALAVKTLIEDWQLSKKLPDAPTVVLKETEVVRLLAPLAYWMHEEKPSGLVTQAEVEEQLAEQLAELNDIEQETESVRQAVEEFLRKVRETTGIFVERAPGVYGFMHLTFEEYFAARYIADNDQSEILSLIDKHFYEPRWNEPILLALGYYGIHFNAQVDKLLKKLFSKLDTYEPTLQGGDIRIKNASSNEAILVCPNLPDKSETSKLEVKLKDLLFAGEVLTQVEVSNSSIRKKIIQKIVITYLCLDTDFEEDTTKHLLRLLRRIESFTQKGEVVALLKQATNGSELSEENRVKAQLAILYIAFSKAGTQLVNCVTDITYTLNPTLFCGILDLVKELGEQMSPAFFECYKYIISEKISQNTLSFLTPMTFLSQDNYEKAITHFEEVNQISDTNLSPYFDWILADYFKEKEEFNKAYNYYQQCFQKLTLYTEPSALRPLWLCIGVCHRLHGNGT